MGILGTGHHVPERVLDNDALERLVETSDDWIVTRTGMRERRIAAAEEATSDMAAAAGRRALEAAGLAPADLELLLVATTTPDHYCCPPTACLVQRALAATRAAGFDVTAACTGFINALTAAHGMIAAGTFRNALVIGADKLSSVTDYKDRETCVLFGDAAGAVVLGAEAPGGHLIDHVLGIDGEGAGMIEVPAGGSKNPSSHDTVARGEHTLRLEGRKVFKFAVGKIAELIETLADRNGIRPQDIDLLIPHQANLRILESAAERTGISMDRVFVNIDRYGNTSSASVPLALDEAARSGRLQRGDLVALAAFGGGLTWGASLLRW